MVRDYARRYHQAEVRAAERDNHRRVRRQTREALGQLTGPAGDVDDADLLLGAPDDRDVTWDVC